MFKLSGYFNIRSLPDAILVPNWFHFPSQTIKIASWRRLEASWRRLGASSVRLGDVLGRLGCVLGVSWGVLKRFEGVK